MKAYRIWDIADDCYYEPQKNRSIYLEISSARQVVTTLKRKHQDRLSSYKDHVERFNGRPLWPDSYIEKYGHIPDRKYVIEEYYLVESEMYVI